VGVPNREGPSFCLRSANPIGFEVDIRRRNAYFFAGVRYEFEVILAKRHEFDGEGIEHVFIDIGRFAISLHATFSVAASQVMISSTNGERARGASSFSM
jgi:hypothetical protein